MAAPRPHGTRFSKLRPEPFSLSFRSMRPCAVLLLCAAFLMAFVGVQMLDAGDPSSDHAVSPLRSTEEDMDNLTVII